MDSQALVTVVIPVRNRAEIVGRTLRSVAAQTLRPLTVVVVDNGSSDATLSVVSRWAESVDDLLDVEIVAEPTVGACQARNRGLELVETPYVAFFDSDDEMAPEHLATVADLLRRHPDTDIAFFDVAIIDEDGWSERRTCPADGDMMMEHLLRGALSTQRFVGRTSLIRAVGGWDAECLRWNDLELGVRLLLSEPKIEKASFNFPSVRIHPTRQSITGSGRFFDEECRCETTLDVIEQRLADAKRDDALRWLYARKAILAAHYAREGHGREASRLMDELLDGKSLRDTLKLQAINLAVRLTGHGGALMASHLFSNSAFASERKGLKSLV